MKIVKPCMVIISKDNINTVFVTNEHGKTYYFRKFDTPVNACKIRMPDIGNYKLSINGQNEDNGSIKYLPLIPAKFTADMPFKQRNRLKPYTIKLNTTMTGTPARIHTQTGLIEVSPAFKAFPVFAQKFILFHEIGHFFYKSEEYADMFAAKTMLEKGYNPSSIMYTLQNVLKRSPLAKQRMSTMFNNLDS